MGSQECTTVLISGGNSGFGIEVVKSLMRHSRPYHIFVGSRSLEKAKEAISKAQHEISDTRSKVTPVQLDLTDDQSIAQAFKTVSDSTSVLDVLINNAGVNLDMSILSGDMSVREAWNASWDVNVTGTQILTETFAGLVVKSKDPRILFITSGTSSLEYAFQGIPTTRGQPDAGWPKPPPRWSITSYRSTKAGMNMMMLEWKRLLEKDNVKMWCVAPGLLATNLGGLSPGALRRMGAKEPSEASGFIVDIIEGKRDADHGKVIHPEGVQPW